jgi:hypothetical protein
MVSELNPNLFEVLGFFRYDWTIPKFPTGCVNGSATNCN